MTAKCSCEKRRIGEPATSCNVVYACFGRCQENLGLVDAEPSQPFDRGLACIGFEEIEESRTAISHVCDQLVHRDLFRIVMSEPFRCLFHQSCLAFEVCLFGVGSHGENRGKGVGSRREKFDKSWRVRGFKEIGQAEDAMEGRFHDDMLAKPLFE